MDTYTIDRPLFEAGTSGLTGVRTLTEILVAVLIASVLVMLGVAALKNRNGHAVSCRHLVLLFLCIGLCTTVIACVSTGRDVEISFALRWGALVLSAVVGSFGLWRFLRANHRPLPVALGLALLAVPTLLLAVWATQGAVRVVCVSSGGRSKAPWFEDAFQQSQALASSGFHDAWSAAQAGNTEAATAEYDWALECASRTRAVILLHRGENRYNEGKYNLALDDFREVAGSMPQLTFVAVRIYACFIRLGRPDDARKILIGFAAHCPDSDGGQISNTVQVAVSQDAGPELLSHVRTLEVSGQARSTYCIVERLLAASKPEDAKPFIEYGLKLAKEPETTLARWHAAMTGAGPR